MNIFIKILIFLAIVTIGINIYQIDFLNFTHSKNHIAFIGVFASICAILILVIFKNSKKLIEKLNNK
jgi:hypothetical protein